MTQIHGSLTIDKVDQTMYAILLGPFLVGEIMLIELGNNFKNNINSARKSPKQ